MKKLLFLIAVVLLAVFAASPNILVKILYHTDEIFFGIHSAFFSPDEVSENKKVNFVGDVMLARHVETLMKRGGSNYPYRNLESEDKGVWVGNFEATVPNNHVQTENFKFGFSVDKKHLNALGEFGFEYLSLANNHSFDFGEKVFVESKDNLSDFTVFGHPSEVSFDSLTYIPLGKQKLGVLALHATHNLPEGELLKKVIDELTANSDEQIAYIHWGEEYKLTHNNFQENLAKMLVDSGIDAVIGHHPHVVQDIDIYKNKLIFYSLGNFIFDQYFDNNVQQGLVLSLSIVNDEISYELVPVSTIFQQAAPSLMSEQDELRFLNDLAKRSNPALSDAILSKIIAK